jgi:hypothetical protein
MELTSNASDYEVTPETPETPEMDVLGSMQSMFDLMESKTMRHFERNRFARYAEAVLASGATAASARERALQMCTEEDGVFGPPIKNNT